MILIYPIKRVRYISTYQFLQTAFFISVIFSLRSSHHGRKTAHFVLGNPSLTENSTLSNNFVESCGPNVVSSSPDSRLPEVVGGGQGSGDGGGDGGSKRGSKRGGIGGIDGGLAGLDGEVLGLGGGDGGSVNGDGGAVDVGLQAGGGSGEEVSLGVGGVGGGDDGGSGQVRGAGGSGAEKNGLEER